MGGGGQQQQQVGGYAGEMRLLGLGRACVLCVCWGGGGGVTKSGGSPSHSVNPTERNLQRTGAPPCTMPI
jgi:hypothetical protein